MPPNKQDGGPNHIDPESAMQPNRNGQRDLPRGKVSSSEEPVSTKAQPNPQPTESGNTAVTRTTRKTELPEGEDYPGVGDDASRGPNDYPEATGRDHPSRDEHAKGQSEKLHGTSDRKINGQT